MPQLSINELPGVHPTVTKCLSLTGLDSVALITVLPSAERLQELVHKILLQQQHDADLLRWVTFAKDEFTQFFEVATTLRDALLAQEALDVIYPGSKRHKTMGGTGPTTSGQTPQRPQPDQVQSTKEKTLRFKEDKAKDKAVCALYAIMLQAGQAAGLAQHLNTLCGEQADELVMLVLGQGAARSINSHVGRWKRIEQWREVNIVQNKSVGDLFPPSLQLVVSYTTWAIQKGMGSTVPDSVIQTIRFMCRRLRMTCPDLTDPVLHALKNEAVSRMAEATKEAQPYPLETIKLMEEFLAKNTYQRVPVRALLLGMVLCMIMASLRFDDALHTVPSKLTFDGDTLRGESWQTKVERRRKGTKFAVVNAFFKHEWLPKWFEGQQQANPPHDQDFWIPNIRVLKETFQISLREPANYASSLQALKLALSQLGDKAKCKVTQEFATKVTWHSCRTTMVDMAARAGKSPLEIQLQMRSATPEMAEKYTRSRQSIPINMVRSLVEASKASDTYKAVEKVKVNQAKLADEENVVVSAHTGEEQSDDEPDDLQPRFFKCGSYSGAVYHIAHHFNNSVALCSSQYKLTTSGELQTVIEPGSEVCKRCVQRRPEALW